MSDSSSLTDSIAPELRFAAELSSRLSENGVCDLYYATAEMQPFSNAQKPDLVYRPNSGAFAGQTIFIEIKDSPKHFGHARDVQVLIERFNFAEDYLETPILLYFFVTGISFSDFSKVLLKNRRIYVIDNATCVNDVIEGMRAIGI